MPQRQRSCFLLCLPLPVIPAPASNPSVPDKKSTHTSLPYPQKPRIHRVLTAPSSHRNSYRSWAHKILPGSSHCPLRSAFPGQRLTLSPVFSLPAAAPAIGAGCCFLCHRRLFPAALVPLFLVPLFLLYLLLPPLYLLLF